MARKVGRPKAGQERLTQERILRTALALVDREGIAALSMRRLASLLGVDPMAIYRHLPDKRAVLAGVVAMALGELQPPVRPEDCWQDQVRALARAYRSLARAHPNLVLQLVVDADAAAEAALPASEALYAALVSAGLPPQAVVRAADLVVDFLNGYALAESSGRLGQPDERQEMLERLAALPADRFPALRRVYGSLSDADLAADFEAELSILIAGIEALVRDHAQRPPTP